MFGNGVAIIANRGLDLFRVPSASGLRFCRGAIVHYYELDRKQIAEQVNVAAKVAGDARNLPVDSVSSDLLTIEALVKDSKGKSDEESAAKEIRNTLEGERAKQVIDDAGDRFTSEGVCKADCDGYNCPAACFAANFDIFDGERLLNDIRESVEFK